jgi:hypothetical protein
MVIWAEIRGTAEGVVGVGRGVALLYKLSGTSRLYNVAGGDNGKGQRDIGWYHHFNCLRFGSCLRLQLL